MFSSIIHNNIKYFIIELLMTYWKKKKKKVGENNFFYKYTKQITDKEKFFIVDNRTFNNFL